MSGMSIQIFGEPVVFRFPSPRMRPLIPPKPIFSACILSLIFPSVSNVVADRRNASSVCGTLSLLLYSGDCRSTMLSATDSVIILEGENVSMIVSKIRGEL